MELIFGGFPGLGRIFNLRRVWDFNCVPNNNNNNVKLTTGGSLLDQHFAILCAPGLPGLPQTCFVMSLVPGTRKNIHDLVSKSRVKESEMLQIASCRNW